MTRSNVGAARANASGIASRRRAKLFGLTSARADTMKYGSMRGTTAAAFAQNTCGIHTHTHTHTHTHAKIRCARRLPRAGPRADKQTPHARCTQQVCECSPPRRGNQLRKLARRCASPDTAPRTHGGRHQSRPQMASVWPCVFEH